jgi:hypothetical protein
MADKNHWREVFADPKSAFRTRKTAKEIIAECLVSLDANVLLAPYRIPSEPFHKIVGVYKRLAEAGRLIVTGQAAREFLKHRNSVIASAIEKLNKDVNRQLPGFENIALLKSISEYERVLAIRDEIRRKYDEQRELLKRVGDELRGWECNDPVIAAYGEILSPYIQDLDQNEENEAIGQSKARKAEKIAPGWKDDGPGDFIIWKTLLKKVAPKRRDLIFVTSEKKDDWWDKVQQEPYLPSANLSKNTLPQVSDMNFIL